MWYIERAIKNKGVIMEEPFYSVENGELVYQDGDRKDYLETQEYSKGVPHLALLYNSGQEFDTVLKHGTVEYVLSYAEKNKEKLQAIKSLSDEKIKFLEFPATPGNLREFFEVLNISATKRPSKMHERIVGQRKAIDMSI
jgi:hypothetical protein